MPLITPPNTLKIDKLYAYLSKDEAGNEGLCAGPMPGFNSPIPMPLIAADPARLASITPIAEALAIASGMTITLVEFSVRTDLRDITGKST